jgi:hypothetical protein
MPKKKPAPKKPATVLVLRTCAADLTSHGGFRWPKSGPVECPDWKRIAECGNGLHGLLWGEGGGELLDWDPDAKWLVVEVEAASIVKIDAAKVKFPRGVVVFCGDRKGATDYLAARAPASIKAIVGGTSTSGYLGTSTSGYRGTSTSGYLGTSTSGYRGTSTSGDGGTSTSGYLGTSTSGYGGTSTSGDGGTSTSGYLGTSTSGYRGTSTSGYLGTSTSGYRGTSTSGDGGILNIRWWDGKRYRIATFYVGEDGIEANQPYHCDENGKPVKGKHP